MANASTSRIDGDLDAQSPAADLVPPSATELEALYELAMAGNMRSIRRHADHIASLDPQFRPFADKLRQLTQTYQSKAILGLIERHMQQLKVQP